MSRSRVIALTALAIVLAFGSVAAAAAASKTVTIRVEGMHCEGCASSVEKKLKATEGVEEARVSFEKREAWVRYDDGKVTVARLREVIDSTGFKAAEEKSGGD